MSMGPSGPSFTMIATIYILLFILAVMAITYPEEFPKLIQDPKALLDGIGMESRRRWLILKFGTQLWISKKAVAVFTVEITRYNCCGTSQTTS